MLFAADTPWNWDAERTFAHLKEQNAGLMTGGDAARLSVAGSLEKRRLSIDQVEMS